MLFLSFLMAWGKRFPSAEKVLSRDLFPVSTSNNLPVGKCGQLQMQYQGFILKELLLPLAVPGAGPHVQDDLCLLLRLQPPWPHTCCWQIKPTSQVGLWPERTPQEPCFVFSDHQLVFGPGWAGMLLAQQCGHTACNVFNPFQLFPGYCHGLTTVSTDEYIILFPQTI